MGRGKNWHDTVAEEEREKAKKEYDLWCKKRHLHLNKGQHDKAEYDQKWIEYWARLI